MTDQLLTELWIFVTTIRVNLIHGPDKDADWDELHEWAERLETRLGELVREEVKHD